MSEFARHAHVPDCAIQEDLAKVRSGLVDLVAQRQAWLLLPEDHTRDIELALIEVAILRQQYKLDYLLKLWGWRQQQRRIL